MNTNRPLRWHESTARLLILFLSVLVVLAVVLWGCKRYVAYREALRIELMTRHYEAELKQQMHAVEAEQRAPPITDVDD